MNKFLLALCSAALASWAWAQEDDSPGAAKPVPSDIETVSFIVHKRAKCESCEPKVCVPELSKTKTPRTYFECECKDYCLPRCPFPFCGCCKKGCKDRGPGPCPKCSKPRTRNVLIKKQAMDETESWRCVPKKIDELACPNQ